MIRGFRAARSGEIAANGMEGLACITAGPSADEKSRNSLICACGSTTAINGDRNRHKQKWGNTP